MKFALFGDLHYSYNYRNVSNYPSIQSRFYQHFFTQLFEQDSDYYISIGDLTNTGHPEEYQGVFDIIQGFDQSKQFHLSIGNHDLYIPTLEVAEQAIGRPLYYSFSTEDLCIIILNTSRQQNAFDWSGVVDQAQLDWLESVLSNNSDKVVVIFAHHPVYGTTHTSTEDKNSIIPESSIKTLLSNHQGKGFYINGHTHTDSIEELGQWTFIQVSSVIDQPAIRLIDIDRHSFKLETIAVEESYRQLGTWLGANTDFFNLTWQGYRGDHNRNYYIEY